MKYISTIKMAKKFPEFKWLEGDYQNYPQIELSDEEYLFLKLKFNLIIFDNTCYAEDDEFTDTNYEKYDRKVLTFLRESRNVINANSVG